MEVQSTCNVLVLVGDPPRKSQFYPDSAAHMPFSMTILTSSSLGLLTSDALAGAKTILIGCTSVLTLNVGIVAGPAQPLDPINYARLNNDDRMAVALEPPPFSLSLPPPQQIFPPSGKEALAHLAKSLIRSS